MPLHVLVVGALRRSAPSGRNLNGFLTVVIFLACEYYLLMIRIHLAVHVLYVQCVC